MSLNIALLLTGTQTLVGIIYIMVGISGSVWNNIGVVQFAMDIVSYLPMMCVFAALVMLVASEKPFTKTLTVCMRIIAGIYAVAAVILPRLEGYSTSFEIINLGNGPLIDGNMLTIGIVIWVLSTIIKEGFDIQKETEEIL